jgi:hypothetical protein
MHRDSVNHLVMIGGPTNIVVESTAAPPLPAPQPVRANVAASKPPHDETKQVMARRRGCSRANCHKPTATVSLSWPDFRSGSPFRA